MLGRPWRDEPKPFLDHLEDLRHVLLWAGLTVALGMGVAAPFAPHLFEWLKRPLLAAGRDPDTFLIQLEVMGGFALTVQIVFWSGLLLAAPFLVLLAGAFVFPGLRESERRVAVWGGAAAALLFALGTALGYAVTLPFALRIMLGIGDWIGVATDRVMATDYVRFVTRLLLGFGLAFELPAVVYGLGCLGVVRVEQLRRVRRHVVVGLLVLAMLLTPPDPVTQILLAAPLYLLYELCIVLLAVRAAHADSGCSQDGCTT
jgi:sec-independent protein translocase protein TatC